MLARELQDCLRFFRPIDERLSRLYDHIVESDLLGMLIGPALSGQLGLTLKEWFAAWRDSADELVPDYVDVEYSEAELVEMRTRVTHAILSAELDPDEREELREDLEQELQEGE